jgi:hypothetical protein
MKKEAYEEPPSAFLEIFGDTPMLRLLNFLAVYDDFDYAQTDIARLAGVHYNTLRSLWPQLEQSGIVSMTRKVGKAKMYQLDQKSPLAKKFRDFYWTVIKEEMHKELTRRGKLPVTVKIKP